MFCISLGNSPDTFIMVIKYNVMFSQYYPSKPCMVLLAGYGVFSSVGGRSSGANGGGSAGRIAIHSSRIIQYQGRYQVFGGEAADDSNAGGGGTVYLQDIR